MAPSQVEKDLKPGCSEVRRRLDGFDGKMGEDQGIIHWALGVLPELFQHPLGLTQKRWDIPVASCVWLVPGHLSTPIFMVGHPGFSTSGPILMASALLAAGAMLPTQPA